MNQKDGEDRFMVSKSKPIVERVIGTRNKYNVYPKYGEPVGIPGICDMILLLVESDKLEFGQSIRVEISGKLL